MAVSTITARVATITKNVKATQPAAKQAGKPTAKQPAKGSVAANCAVLNVNPAVIDYTTWKPAELRAEYAKRFGITPSNSAKRAALEASLLKGFPTMPTHAKAYATKLYKDAMGCDPTKSWKVEVILDAIKSKRLPGQRAGGSAADGKRLISAAVALGVVTREQAKGRSQWKADEVRAFVAKHRLTERIQVVEVK
jgi:hypothetical protein